MGSKRFHRDPELAWQELNGEVLILATEQGKVHELNSVAATIWKAMESPRSKHELIAAVIEEFDAQAEQVEADIEEVLATWAKLQLVRQVA